MTNQTPCVRQCIVQCIHCTRWASRVTPPCRTLSDLLRDLHDGPLRNRLRHRGHDDRDGDPGRRARVQAAGGRPRRRRTKWCQPRQHRGERQRPAPQQQRSACGGEHGEARQGWLVPMRRSSSQGAATGRGKCTALELLRRSNRKGLVKAKQGTHALVVPAERTRSRQFWRPRRRLLSRAEESTHRS